MRIELHERPLDQFRNMKGVAKTRFWKKHEEEIIAQGQADDRRRKQKQKRK